MEVSSKLQAGLLLDGCFRGFRLCAGLRRARRCACSFLVAAFVDAAADLGQLARDELASLSRPGAAEEDGLVELDFLGVEVLPAGEIPGDANEGLPGRQLFFRLEDADE